MNGSWFEQQNDIFQVVITKFCRRLKKDLEVNVNAAIPRSKDMLFEDIILTKSRMRKFSKPFNSYNLLKRQHLMVCTYFLTKNADR